MATWVSIQNSDIIKNNRCDSEFFDPSYIAAENKVLAINHRLLNSIGNFIPGPFGSSFLVSNYERFSQFRYIRGKDVKPFILEDNDCVYISEADYKRLIKYSIAKNDLIISVVGTLGNVALVSSEQGVFSCKSTILRNATFPAHYLLAFLNSDTGKKCLLRRQRGAVQTGLNIDDLKLIPIPDFDEQIKNAISSKVEKSIVLRKQSKLYFLQAQTLLEKELGLDKFFFNKSKSYSTNINSIFKNNRCDSEYYDPAFEKVWQLLGKHEIKPLSSLCSLIGYGTVPTSPYKEKGIPYVKGLNLKNTFIEGKLDFLDVNSTKILPKRYFLKPMDVIISQMGSVGFTGLVLPEQEDFLFASFTIRARLRDYEKVDPYYLSFYINNIARPYYIMRKIAQASVRQNTDLPTLRNMPVVIINKDKQLEISDLLKLYKTTKTESENLLKDAIKQIDYLLETEAAKNETN